MSSKTSAERFSHLVSGYVEHRPSYPKEILETIIAKHDLAGRPVTIVDLGSGTGILTKQILELLPDARVIGVEPNAPMRMAGDDYLAAFRDAGRFESVEAKAESTGLPSHSADFIVAAQAFHWFDKAKARAECHRLLSDDKNAGVALVWNDRRGANEALGTTPFMQAYEGLLRQHSRDYANVNHHATVTPQVISAFFGPGGYQVAQVANPYRLNFGQLQGRMLSSSYSPQAGDAGHDELLFGLRQAFDRFQHDGRVEFVYDTRAMYGQISGIVPS